MKTAIGSQKGLERIMMGAKKIKARMIAVRVRPVSRRRMPPEMARVRKPMSWEELGEVSWMRRRKVM